jgi:DNA-binding MarR family transcriptional regulator
MPSQKTIAEIRSFNRFYTRLLGVLDQHFLDSPYSLAEVRALFEIYHQTGLTARQLKTTLQIDEGYCSRILDKLAANGLVSRTQAETDRRRYVLALTARGHKVFAGLNQRSDRAIETMVAALSKKEERRLAELMREIRDLLEREEPS